MMTPTNDDNSLGGEATYAGKAAARPQQADVSLGDERTLGGGDAIGFDTVIDDIEVVDLETRYKIEETLGRGGMGAVLLATDMRLGRKVAIKRILGEAAQSKPAIMRFLTEAKAIAAINHPNIVQIHDYGRAKDGPFLIMEYVDGGSLLDQCRGRALPLAEAIDLACQLCNGLAKAHDLGIVHRDIKPANVLLTKDGIPKLTDFGLAKVQASDHAHTVLGAVLGTPDFMPPEQRRDVSLVDHRSDLWSLAATLYQAVTGRSPKIIRFDLLPAELTKVLGKALEDEKEARYQSSREFRDALRAAVGASPVAMDPALSVGEGDIQDGQCLNCSTINPDLSRKFCKKCGVSLRVACLNPKCGEQIPVWDTICGECGGRQDQLAAELQATRQAQAEGLLDDLDFDQATAVATQMQQEIHPRLKPLSDWLEPFLARIDKSRSEQTRHAVAGINKADSLAAAREYELAIAVLQNVPQSLRGSVLPGAVETVDAMLSRIRECIKKAEAESNRLEQLIRQRIDEKALDGLLPLVEELLALRPSREDVAKIRRQLCEREQKLTAARNEAIARVKAEVAERVQEAEEREKEFRFDEAEKLLLAIPEGFCSDDVAERLDRIRRLGSLRRNAMRILAEQKRDASLHEVIAYLQLQPADEQVATLLQTALAQIAARDEAIARAKAEVAERVQEAEELEKEFQFDKAEKLLLAIPQRFCSDDVAERLDRIRRLGSLRRDAMRILAEQKRDASLHEVIAYLQLQPADEQVATLLQTALAQIAARDEAVVSATHALEAHDHEGVIAALTNIHKSVVNAEVRRLREVSKKPLEELRKLKGVIKEAIGDDEDTGIKNLDLQQLGCLVNTVEQYLAISPNDKKNKELYHKLLDRENEMLQLFATFMPRKPERAAGNSTSETEWGLVYAAVAFVVVVVSSVLSLMWLGFR